MRAKVPRSQESAVSLAIIRTVFLGIVLFGCAPTLGGPGSGQVALDPALGAYNSAILTVYTTTDGVRDAYGTLEVTRSKLAPTGMRVVEGDSNAVQGLDLARTLVFEGSVSPRTTLMLVADVDLVVRDVFGNVVFRTRTSGEDAWAWGPAIRAGVAAALERFVAAYPGYNPSTRSLIQRQMDNWPRGIATEANATDVLDSAVDGLDQIEGIWVSDDSGYRLAILRDGAGSSNSFVATVLTAQNFNWLAGMVKIRIQGTAVTGSYTAEYFMGDFSRQGRPVTVAEGVLVVSGLPDGLGGRSDSRFTKVYPSVQPSGRSRGSDSLPETLVHTGSGFLLHESGLIVTNAHVIEGASSISVGLAEGVLVYRASVVLADRSNDLAILQIEEFDFTTDFGGAIPFGLGDSSSTLVGESVLAIGFPLTSVLGTSLRVTDGIISARVGIQDAPNLFQISNPLQPGNSGGPLFNMNGDVVGVVVSSLNAGYVLGQSGALPQNVNFAVKSEYLRSMLQMLPVGADVLARSSSVGALAADGLVSRVAPFIALIEATQ